MKKVLMRVVPKRVSLVVIVTLGVVAAAVALTGRAIVAWRNAHPTQFKAPLLVYPVSRTNPGQCAPGTQGITGPGTSGETCYQVTEGIAIRRVSDIHVQRGTSGYEVSISLLPADSRSFAVLTRKQVGRNVALVVRGRVVTAPYVETPITKGKVLITGTARQDEADRLVRQLKGSGAELPVSTPSSPGPSISVAPGPPSSGLPVPGLSSPVTQSPSPSSSISVPAQSTSPPQQTQRP